MTEETKEVVTRDQRREELAKLAFSPSGQLFQPTNGQQLLDMANMMSTAGFMVKDIYRSNPGACLGLIAICSPYGLNPLQVSWKTYKASKSEDAPIAFEAQVIVAMVNASGAVKGGIRYRYEGEGQKRKCIATGILAGSDEPVEVESPTLGEISVKNSPLWKSDPDQQLAYYTGRAWARRYKPEMLLGVYDVDEIETLPMRDISPRDEPSGPNLAQRLKQRELPPTEPAPTAEPEPPVNPYADIDLTGAFPGSASWIRGETDAQDGKPETDCPYELVDDIKDYVAGHRGAVKAMSDAEG